MMQKNDVRALTEGAMFGALFAVLLALIRFFLSSVDSFIYYILPLPILLYTLRNKKSLALILFFVLVALSFLFLDPYRALLLVTPNLLIGLTYGLLRKSVTNNFLNYASLFLLSLIANFLSLLAFRLIFGLSYFEFSLTDFAFLKNLFNINDAFLSKLLSIIIPLVFIIDALVKALFINVLIILINNKLHLFTYEKGIRLYFRFYLPIIYLISFIPTIIFTKLSFSGKDYTVIIIILYAILGILSLYFLLQYLTLTNYYFAVKQKKGLGLFLAFLGFIVFPIGISIGAYYNFIFNTRGNKQ